MQMHSVPSEVPVHEAGAVTLTRHVSRCPSPWWTFRHNERLTHLLHDVGGEDAGGEGTAEDVGELPVQAADAHLLKVPLGVDDGLPRLLGLGLACRTEEGISGS